MKVLYYHQYFSTPAGAAGTRSYALARFLAEAGHQVQMVCLRCPYSHWFAGPFTDGKRNGLVDGIELISLLQSRRLGGEGSGVSPLQP